MGIYALSQRAGETYDAAGKAMQDVFSVLKERGAKIIWSVPKTWKKYLKIFDIPYLVLFLLFKAGKNDFLFYSIPENKIKIKLLKRIQKIKHYSIICFINDLNAFRYGNTESPDVQAHMREEAQLIGTADYVLMPNENTRKLLITQGIKSKLIPVGIWDYRMTESQIETLIHTRKAVSGEKEKVVIAFAGNLNKSEFLNKMVLSEESDICIELWGKLDESKKESLPAFCHYNGILPADEVPNAICTANYGLVWDGVGADEIEGGLGEYLKYNNSHKCGLYLASGLPAIVWTNSGMANFIKEHECGICIDKLSDMEEKIKKSDYRKLRENAVQVSEDLQKGAYLGQAIDKILAEK